MKSTLRSLLTCFYVGLDVCYRRSLSNFRCGLAYTEETISSTEATKARENIKTS
jgi:hypothetical protein